MLENLLKDEFTRLDPATYTPLHTVVTGEETTGGRMFEITNPFANDPASAGVRWLDKVPEVAHEGIRFHSTGAMYFVDVVFPINPEPNLSCGGVRSILFR